MAISKVDFGGQTLIDLTTDTITAGDLRQGVTAHDKAGNSIVGTLTPSGGVVQIASGQVSGYKKGKFTVSGLSFAPDVIVISFVVTIRNKTSRFYTAAVKGLEPNTAQGLEEFSGAYVNYAYASTVVTDAVFGSSGVEFELISKGNTNMDIGAIDWWAFGGVL